MRILVIIPHYFGPRDPASGHYILGSYTEPLARIAALNETIVCLHRNFGPYRTDYHGRDIGVDGEAPAVLDIVVLAMRERHLLADIGIAPELYQVEFVEGAPSHIPFHAQRLMRDRAGAYDFYGYLEDDIALHDPAFFAKLAWFQAQFGPTTLLAPTRVETGSTGTPGKVVIDPDLGPETVGRFRRAGQREQVQAAWNGRQHKFALPANPHAASFFLTREQLDHWVTQPTFDDGDASWVGPLESAATLSVGKVFDIYKSTHPDPFFLEVHHYGTVYASRHPPAGRRYGEPPLLAIAQNAMRALAERGIADGLSDEALAALVSKMRAAGTMAEMIGQATGVAHASLSRHHRESQSLRWLAKATWSELRRRSKWRYG